MEDWIIDGVRYTTEPTELCYDDLKALSDKRLVLLKRYDKGLQREPDCFSCGIMAFNEDTEMWEHDPDCELAEAIAEE